MSAQPSNQSNDTATNARATNARATGLTLPSGAKKFINRESTTMKKVVVATCIVALFIAAAIGIPALSPSVQAQSGNIWQINFWPNPSWQGYSPFSMQSGVLAFNWGTGAPMPGMPADNFTARATTSAWFSAGTYQFSVQADDEVTLVINGTTWVNTINQGQSGKTQWVNVNLPDGWANIRVDFREFTGNAYLFVDWRMISTPIPGPAPTAVPNPGPAPAPGTVPVPSATSVQTAFGNYTPCIQQNIHQQNCFVSNGSWDAPNAGSIGMEPQILIWGNCAADTVQSMQVFQNTPPQSAACSRTQAGWFPR